MTKPNLEELMRKLPDVRVINGTTYILQIGKSKDTWIVEYTNTLFK